MNFTYTGYHDNPDIYDRMIAGEDETNLLAAIDAIQPLAGLRAVDFGAGTARVSNMLAPHVGRVHAFDLIYPMIATGREKLRRSGCENWTVGVASSLAMPLPTACADLAIEGWSFIQMARWNFDYWQDILDRGVNELLRIVRPGGVAIMIETLGTGSETPAPPADWFAAMYAHLEEQRGFTRTWVRTDIHFASAEEAAELIGFFFGEEIGRQHADRWGAVIPECTGLWWQRV